MDFRDPRGGELRRVRAGGRASSGRRDRGATHAWPWAVRAVSPVSVDDARVRQTLVASSWARSPRAVKPRQVRPALAVLGWTRFFTARDAVLRDRGARW